MTTRSAYKVMGTRQTFPTSSSDHTKVNKSEGMPRAWIHHRLGRSTEKLGRGIQPALRPHYHHPRLVAERETHLKVQLTIFPGPTEDNQQGLPDLLNSSLLKVASQLLKHQNRLSTKGTFCILTLTATTTLRQGQEGPHPQILIRLFH